MGFGYYKTIDTEVHYEFECDVSRMSSNMFRKTGGRQNI